MEFIHCLGCGAIVNPALACCSACGRCVGCGLRRLRIKDPCPDCQLDFCEYCGRCPGCGRLRLVDVIEPCPNCKHPTDPVEIQRLVERFGVNQRAKKAWWRFW